MTWSSSLSRGRNHNKSWSSGRPTRKERDFRSTRAKPRSWCLGQGLMCFNSLACVSRTSAQIPFSLVVVPVGSPKNAMASLAVWSFMPTSGVNSALDRPDEQMADYWQRSQWVGRSLKWWHPSVTLGTAYPQVVVVNYVLPQEAVLHWANSTSSCPPSMQAKPGPQVYLTLYRLQRNDWAMISWMDVRRQHQVPSQLAVYVGEDAAWWSGKVTLHPPTLMAWPCRT